MKINYQVKIHTAEKILWRRGRRGFHKVWEYIAELPLSQSRNCIAMGVPSMHRSNLIDHEHHTHVLTAK